MGVVIRDQMVVLVLLVVQVLLVLLVMMCCLNPRSSSTSREKCRCIFTTVQQTQTKSRAHNQQPQLLP